MAHLTLEQPTCSPTPKPCAGQYGRYGRFPMFPGGAQTDKMNNWRLRNRPGPQGLRATHVGLVATILLALLGITFVADSIGVALIFGGGLGLFLGLLFGGLISLRPDEAAIAVATRDEAEHQGRWSVIVHCLDSETLKRAKVLLGEAGGSVHSTLGLTR